jgi:hypothetical protein
MLQVQATMIAPLRRTEVLQVEEEVEVLRNILIIMFH